MTDVNVVSSPHLLVLDNQTARIQVGDQVPITTQQATSVTSPDAPIVNSIELRDTGVILSVTPRVNASGLVVMELQQEVSNVARSAQQTTTSEQSTPTIAQRQISSTVAVQSGETIVLGGLIQDNRERLPVRAAVPLPAADHRPAVRQPGPIKDRTELLVLLTPRVIRGVAEARAITDEMRRRLQSRRTPRRTAGLALTPAMRSRRRPRLRPDPGALDRRPAGGDRREPGLERPDRDPAGAQSGRERQGRGARGRRRAARRARPAGVDPDQAWRAGGGPYRLTYGEGEVLVSIADEDGKIDLNAAPPELLAGLLGQLGLDAEEAEAMADRIVDFRDPDHEPRPQGAEDPQYVAAGRPTGAQDRPFATESELLGVLGMTPELYRRMRPYITVFSGAEAVDPMHASRVVLAAIPGMTDQLIEAYAKAGPEDDPLASVNDDSVFDIEPYLIPSREVMYTVRAEARTRAAACSCARR